MWQRNAVQGHREERKKKKKKKEKNAGTHDIQIYEIRPYWLLHTSIFDRSTRWKNRLYIYIYSQRTRASRGFGTRPVSHFLNTPPDALRSHSPAALLQASFLLFSFSCCLLSLVIVLVEVVACTIPLHSSAFRTTSRS